MKRSGIQSYFEERDKENVNLIINFFKGELEEIKSLIDIRDVSELHQISEAIDNIEDIINDLYL